MTLPNDGKSWLLAIVESALERTDYHAQHVARVVSQDSAGLLSVVPDNKRLPAMVGVPIRYGVPGISAKVESGARVLVGFEGGDRRFPIATVWESAALTELRITAKTKVVVDCPDIRIGDEDGAPVARVGDPVDVIFDVSAVSVAIASNTGILVAVGVISAGAAKARAS